MDSNNPGVVAPAPSDKVRESLEHRRVYEAIAWMAFAQAPIASLDTFTKGVQSFQQTLPALVPPLRREIYEVLGAAHLVRLKLDKARQFFLGAGRQDLLKNVLAVALRHGQFPVVKEFLKEGAISRGEYEDFLRKVALPRFPLHYNPQRGFFLDEKELFALFKQLPDTPEECLEQAVELMERSGDLNFVKKFIFANYAKNQRLIDRYAPAFNALAGRNRKDIPKLVEAFCAQEGVTIKKMIQEGDLTGYFPKSSFLFLVSRNAKDVRVWKEHLQLPLDYSQPGSYSQEKAILEFFAKQSNTPAGFIQYFGSVKIPSQNLELLEIEFAQGENLRHFTATENLLPESRVVAIIAELAEMLSFLHAHGIIYMDVKAKNVIVTATGIKLLDFGMTQFIDPKRDPAGTVYSLLSTPEYVPPEMATTFSATTEADVFQLGILFYELITGQHPFCRVNFTEGDEYRESEQLKYALANVYVEPEFDHERFGLYQSYLPLLKSMLAKQPKDRPPATKVAEELRA